MAEVKPMRQLKPRSLPLSVSFPMDEREQVEQAAHLSLVSVSAFIRAAAVKSAHRALAAARKAA